MAVIDTLNVNLQAQTAGLAKGLKQSESLIKGFAGNIKAPLAAVGAAFTGAFAGVFTISKIANTLRAGADFADEISDTAARLQITAESFNQIRHAAELNDVPLEVLTQGMERLAKTLNEAPDVALLKFADQIKNMPNIYDRAAAAAEVFGRQGVKLVPLLSQGSAGILALGKEVEGLFSPERQKLLDDYDNAIKSLRETWMKFAVVAAQEVAPAAILVADKLKEWVDQMTRIQGIFEVLFPKQVGPSTPPGPETWQGNVARGLLHGGQAVGAGIVGTGGAVDLSKKSVDELSRGIGGAIEAAAPGTNVLRALLDALRPPPVAEL